MSSDLKSNVHQITLSLVKSPTSQVYEFEDYRLDAEHLMLYRNDEEVSVTRKQVETLLALVERHGEILSKDALMTRLWGDAAIEEANLIQNIYILRKALGETSDGKPMIETLRRRGYRFSVPLHGHESANSITETSERWSLPRYGVVLGAAVLLAATVISGLYFFAGGTRASDKRSFAVLPLSPIDTTNRNDLFEIGIADAIIQRLSSTKGFVVRPLSSTRKYTDIGQDPAQAGREQKVDYVLSANYQFAAGRIKVTVQLYDVANSQIEEAYQSEREVANVFAAQDAIAADFGNRLMERFGTSLSGPAARRGTTNEEAYRLYLQGMYRYDKRSSADFKKAVELLERAVQLDPEYALAWAGIAHAHRALANFGRNTDIHAEYKKSIEAIEIALGLDPNLSEAHSALCENKFLYEYDFQTAELECKRALELNPNSPLGHEIYGRFLWGRGRNDEAISEVKTAIDLEPASLLNQRNLGAAYFYARRGDEAVAQFKRVIAMDENFVTGYLWLIDALRLSGNESEAFEWWMKFLSRQKTDEETVLAYKTAFETSGWQGIAGENLRRFEKGDQQFFHGALYCLQVGDKDKAFEMLERSFERREAWFAQLRAHPGLDSLRDDARYQDLVNKLEIKSAN